MGRNNGTFKYQPVQQAVRDPKTGLYSAGSPAAWETGSECQIEKFIPAKQKIGTDGIVYTYTYDVFIPRYVTCEFTIGGKMQIISDNGVTDEFEIQGIDDLNRKYIEVWG